MYRDRDTFFSGVNNYVPAMQGSGNKDKIVEFDLGTPAASDDDLIDASIDADAVAGTEETQSWTSDSPYGRTLILTISADPGAASSVIDVYGFDYLGQRMIERFTTANGSTAIQYGKKAFYKVDKTRIVTAATNAVTAKLGTGTRLGLPYKGDVIWSKEGGVIVPLYKRDVTVWRDIPGASIAGGPSGAWVYADFPGFVKTLIAVADMPVGSTNDPAITVELATVAIVGLTVTSDVSAAATGALVTDTPTTAGYSANNRFVVGSLIEIVLSDADAAVGAVSVGLVLTPTQFTHPVTTDPATAITGDPRGTYDGLTVPDGTARIVGMILDNGVNASNNGGLHGIRHFSG